MADVIATNDLACNEARAFERLDVLRDGGERHVETRNEFADVMRTLGKQSHDFAARAVCERLKEVVQMFVTMLNHAIECFTEGWESQTVLGVCILLLEDTETGYGPRAFRSVSALSSDI